MSVVLWFIAEFWQIWLAFFIGGLFLMMCSLAERNRLVKAPRAVMGFDNDWEIKYKRAERVRLIGAVIFEIFGVLSSTAAVINLIEYIKGLQ